jgi:alpha-L-rhamnosidase
MNPSMNSFSHYAFGAVCEWMFDTLAGIDTDGPGYARLRIEPHVPRAKPLDEGTPPLEWVRARYDSIRGPIDVQWRRDGKRLEVGVSIPANTTAMLTVPATDAAAVQVDPSPESGPEVRVTGFAAGRAQIELESGRYRVRTTIER